MVVSRRDWDREQAAASGANPALLSTTRWLLPRW
jgi:hypothetical protein